jgi:hypothetical protein
LRWKEAYYRSYGWRIAKARSLHDIPRVPAPSQHDDPTPTDSKQHILLTGIVHPDIDLPSESFLYISNELVDLGTGIDVALERLDLDAVLGRELGGDGGSIGRGVCYGNISTGYKR